MEHERARVLVVDDEEAQRSALAGMIGLWGYQVETAADGQEALEKLETFPAQVMITDVKMPRMDGEELLRRLKGQRRGPAIHRARPRTAAWKSRSTWCTIWAPSGSSKKAANPRRRRCGC